MNEKSKIEADILEVLSTVIDPELQIDIVNLGLVNHVAISESGCVEVNMTLTTMGCPLLSVLESLIDDALKILPEVTETHVSLIWQPDLIFDRMSCYAKVSLGLI